MKKRVFVVCVLIVFVALVASSLTSCDLFEEEAIDLSGQNIVINFFGETEFEYKGYEIRPRLWVMDGYDAIEEYYDGVPNENIVVEYENNTEVGTATVTVTPGTSGKYTGKAVAHFEIVAASKKKEAADLNSLKEYLAGGRYANVTLTADITVPEGESITVAEGVKVDMGGYTFINNGTFENNGEMSFNEYGEDNALVNGGTFKNNGKLTLYVPEADAEALINEGDFENAGEIYFVGKEEKRFVARNYGDFDNAGVITFNRYVDFYNYGAFANGGDVKNSSEDKFFTNSDVTGNAVKYISRRYPLTEFEISLSEDTRKYNGEAHKPSINFVKEGYKVDYGDYEAVYENNVEVGTATVTVYPTEDSDAFYGDPYVLHFEIVP